MKHLVWFVSLLLAFSAGYFVNHFSSETPPLDGQPKVVMSAEKNAAEDKRLSATTTAARAPATNIAEKESDDEEAATASELAQQLKALVNRDPMAFTFSDMANMYMFVSNLSEAQLLAIIHDLSSKESEENNTVFTIFYGRYAEINPTAALDFAMTDMVDEQLKNALLSISLVNLAKQDPLASYERFVALTGKSQGNEGISKQRLSSSLIATFSGLAKQDMSLAIDKLNELSQLGHGVMMPLWGLTQGLESKQEFLDLLTLTESFDNHEIEEGIISEWARHDPEQVGEWLLKDYSGERLEQLKDNFVQTWGYNDRESSGNWLVDNTAPDKAGKKVVDFLRSWAWDEPEAAMQWFTKQPDAIYNQKTFADFVNDAAYRKPQFAMKYMSYLDSKKDQQRLSKTIYRSLKRKSTQQASDFLEQSPFKDEILEFDEYMKNSL